MPPPESGRPSASSSLRPRKPKSKSKSKQARKQAGRPTSPLRYPSHVLLIHLALSARRRRRRLVAAHGRPARSCAPQGGPDLEPALRDGGLVSRCAEPAARAADADTGSRDGRPELAARAAVSDQGPAEADVAEDAAVGDKEDLDLSEGLGLADSLIRTGPERQAVQNFATYWRQKVSAPYSMGRPEAQLVLITLMEFAMR
ncbi:hypothetical protein P7C73_g4601, partial [Tremellales sp. Uapishka_1]